jgi:hypothetical protein
VVLASDSSRLVLLSWPDANVVWQSDPLGGSVARANQIVLEDVDGDGDAELIAGSSYRLSQFAFALPPAPSWLTVAGGIFPDRVVVSWEDVPGENCYDIFRAAGEGGGEFLEIGSVGSGVTTFTDSLRCGEGPNRYHVRAAGVFGTSQPSPEASGGTTACAFAVTSPNGSEQWRQGISRLITWDGREGTGTGVSIDLLHGGTLEHTIAAGTPNDGRFTWLPPDSVGPGADYRIRITPHQRAEAADESDGTFSVALARITVTAPNGGELWTRGTRRTIRWSRLGTAGAVRIVLLRRGRFVLRIAARTANDGSFLWRVPTNLIPGGDYRIRVAAQANRRVTDVSNATFRIGR